MRASDTVQTFFDEVKVPVRYTVGQPGQGFIYQMQQFQEERLWAGAGTLMGCDRIINATIDYTRERQVFGKPLLDNQVVHFRLAELKSEVEALRSLVYRACEDYLAGKDVTMLASMAKLKAGRLRREVSDACLQYWGGAGYLWDNPVARSYRDGRLGSIGGGADEVMLQIISKLMGTMPRSGESLTCNSPRNTTRSAARCAPSSTGTSIRTSTNGKRTASSPRTRSSRSWAAPACSASTSRSNTAAWGSTIPTPW